MPKFTALPEALVAKDNDIICIVDPDAAVSKKMTMATLKQVQNQFNSIGGAADQGLLLTSGAAPVLLSGFAEEIGLNTDALAGSITVPVDGSYKVSLFSHITGTALKNVQFDLTLDIDAGTTQIFSADSSLGNFNHTKTTLYGKGTITLTAGQVLRMGLSTVNATFTVNVANSQLILELI